MHQTALAIPDSHSMQVCAQPLPFAVDEEQRALPPEDSQAVPTPVAGDVYVDASSAATDAEKLSPLLRSRIAEATVLDDLLAMPAATIGRWQPAVASRILGRELPVEGQAKVAQWVSTLQDQARLATSLSDRLARCQNQQERAALIAGLLDKVARTTWEPKLALRRWMQAVLPQSLWLPYGFQLDEPDKASITVGSPGNPHHIVIELGPKDFARVYRHEVLSTRHLNRKTRSAFSRITAYGFNTPFNAGQVSIVRSGLPDQVRRAAIAHECSHGVDRIVGSLNLASPPNTEDAMARARWLKDVQPSLIKTEIIAYLTMPESLPMQKILWQLLDPQSYSQHLWSAYHQYHAFAGETFLRRHYQQTVQGLQAASVVLVHPQGAHLLRLTAMEDWPILASDLSEAGMLDGVPPFASMYRRSSSEHLAIQSMHDLTLKLQRQTAFLQQNPQKSLPESVAFSPADLALIAWAEGRALQGKNLLLDESILLQEVQNAREAWVRSSPAVPAIGTEISTEFGSGFLRSRRLAGENQRRHALFFPP